ncbi:MAG: anti-sigma factor [Actinomycetota bacterium]|nr:anti-sigma factor [Actinomycetota bacterium]
MGVTHDEIKSLIAPYVLGAVTTEEERTVRSHIMGCEECMREAEGLSGPAAALALAVDEAPVPGGFADSVLARVQSERPAPSESPAKADGWFRWRKVLAGVAAASVVATIVLASALLAQRAQVRRYEDAVPPLVHGEGMRLAGAGGAVARMVPTADGATLFATGLDAAPDRHTYQLWLMECVNPEVIETCDPVSAGTFDMTGGIAVLETRSSLEGYDRAAVTVEPDGGSEAPTTLPVIDSAA